MKIRFATVLAVDALASAGITRRHAALTALDYFEIPAGSPPSTRVRSTRARTMDMTTLISSP
jgi:hypothetical protein